MAVTSTLFLFFVEYRLGDADMAGPFLLLFFVAAALAAPAWSMAARKWGARRMLALGMGLSIAAFAWAWTLGTGDEAAFVVICLASGAALGADMTLLPALFARRIAEIDGNGAEAFGLWSFCAKFTLADLCTYYCFGLAVTPATQVVGIDLLSEQPQIAELLEHLAKRPSIARVTAEPAS